MTAIMMRAECLSSTEDGLSPRVCSLTPVTISDRATLFSTVFTVAVRLGVGRGSARSSHCADGLSAHLASWTRAPARCLGGRCCPRGRRPRRSHYPTAAAHSRASRAAQNVAGSVTVRRVLDCVGIEPGESLDELQLPGRSSKQLLVVDIRGFHDQGLPFPTTLVNRRATCPRPGRRQEPGLPRVGREV